MHRAESVTSSRRSARSKVSTSSSPPTSPRSRTPPRTFARLGVRVEAVEADLATREGVDALHDAAQAAGPVDALLANAGHGLGHAFLDQDFDDVRHVIDTNVTGHDLPDPAGRPRHACARRGPHPDHRLDRRLHARHLQAVYNGTKAFIDSFSFALRAELKDTGVTVTCLMPGATETEFFERADMLDTKVGQAEEGRSRRRRQASASTR